MIAIAWILALLVFAGGIWIAVREERRQLAWRIELGGGKPTAATGAAARRARAS